MNYYLRFIEAIERTKNWGLYPGDVVLDYGSTYIDTSSTKELSALYKHYVRDFPEIEKANCLAVSDALVDKVANILNTDAYLTIGSVQRSGVIFYEKCTEKYLLHLLNTPDKKRDKISVHSWITLSSGEIVDFTFTKGMALKYERWKTCQEAIITSGDPLSTNLWLKYVPMVVGDDFLYRSGDKRWVYSSPVQP